MSTGHIIRSLRKARGLTQSEVAAAIGWERGTIAAIERGHDQPGAELVMALATYFQTTTDHILNRQGAKTPATAQNEAEAEMLARFRDAGDESQKAILAVLRSMTAGRQ
jgi:putative transcriptional regulator